MKWYLVLSVFNFYVSSNLGCLTNPFRAPVGDKSDYNQRLLSGVTQGFQPVHEDPHLSQHIRRPNPETSFESRDHHTPSLNQPETRLSVDVNQMGNGTNRFVTVRNEGHEKEFVQMSAFNSEGQAVSISPSEFYLSGGSSTDIPLTLVSNRRNSQSRQSASEPLELITVQARGKRDSVKRSFFFGESQYNDLEPFCFDKDVTGTCRYRTDPNDCFRWEWTAYATILNRGGSQKITSIPEGLFVLPGEHGRVRVYLKISCCTPVVQFISNDPYYQTNSCVVDVRELQLLHPGEIAGIVLAVLVLIIIIIVVIVICLRKRRKETISVGMLPHHRARSREMISRQ